MISNHVDCVSVNHTSVILKTYFRAHKSRPDQCCWLRDFQQILAVKNLHLCSKHFCRANFVRFRINFVQFFFFCLEKNPYPKG